MGLKAPSALFSAVVRGFASKVTQSAAAGTGMHNGFDPKSVENLSTRERDIVEKRQKLLGPSYQLMYERPVEIVRGKDVYMYDNDGNPYLDCYNNVVSVGHCNPRVIEAVTKQMSTLNTHTRYMGENILNYSAQLLSTFEKELGRVMYTCSASEAVDLALRVAKFNSGGTGIIVTDYAYHGTTDRVAAISSTGGKYVPLDVAVRTVRAPDSYRCDDVEQRLADDIEAAIADMERHGIKFAGFIADMVFSTDGLLTEPCGFLKKAREVVHKHGGIFIADEVQPGFGRTGTHMWGYQRHGIVPDLVVMGKPMGNGIPIAAMVARPELLEEFGDKIRYFNTFAGNPVSIAAAQAVLDEIQGGLLENCREVGEYLLNGFREISAEYPECIGDVRGAGMYFAVEYVKDPISKTPDSELAAKVVSELRDRRILISTSGPEGNSLKIRPLICFKKEHADQLLNGFAETMEKLCGKPHDPVDTLGATAAKQALLSPEVAIYTLKNYYGIDAVEAKKLGSERDQTFRITVSDGSRVLAKFAHPAEDRLVTNLQTSILRYIEEKDPSLGVPRVIPALSGELEPYIDCEGQMRTVVLHSFVEGTMLLDAPHSVRQSYNLGVEAGKLAKALEGFRHPKQDLVLSWDLQHASLLRSYMNLVESPENYRKLELCIENFEREVKPRLGSLRKRVVHNDHSFHNAFVNPEAPDEIVGVIDFGDAVSTQVINDVAIGAYYQLGVGGLLDGALAFAREYNDVVPLSKEERGLLFDLILTRLFVSIINGLWRAHEAPENKDYLLRLAGHDWKHLDALMSLRPEEGREKFASLGEH